MVTVMHTDAWALCVNLRFIHCVKIAGLQQFIHNAHLLYIEASSNGVDTCPSSGEYLKLQGEIEAPLLKKKTKTKCRLYKCVSLYMY